ncbi:ABC transporter permease [Allorhizocola rhizosphaerae]|uniref:ABC transporter permease n=1 Tax=Allorhizocola rhizosphaerae TaxID=1872709 RepID=UPI001B8B6125|nr:ABC transporter permease [Allorhizocola rhizosphaerae]
MRSAGAVVGLFLLALLAFLAFMVPAFTPDPDATAYGDKLAQPSWAHLLGTDAAGRDVLARVAAGARISLGGALLVGVAGVVVGLLVGLAAALVGGVVDALLSRLIDVVLAVPTLLLALAVVGVLGPGLRNLLVAMVLAGWAPIARLARAWAAERLGRPYVTAARLAGLSRWRAARLHVVPPTAHAVLAVATLGLGETILGLAGLSFVGLGVQPPTAEWGQLVAENRLYATTAPWLVLAPGAAIVLSVAAVTLLADAWLDRAAAP